MTSPSLPASRLTRLLCVFALVPMLALACSDDTTDNAGSNTSNANTSTADAGTGDTSTDDTGDDANASDPLGLAQAPPPTPDTLAQFGYARVTLDLSATRLAPSEVTRVEVAGIMAYDLAPSDDGTLTFTVQGAPEPGPATIQLITDQDAHALPEPLTYTAPADPRFARVVALGASLSFGTQSGVPTIDSIPEGTPALVASRMGGFFPMPLLKRDFFTPIGLGDISAPPECAGPFLTDFTTDAAVNAAPLLTDPETGLASFAQGRVDPDLTGHLVAVPSFRIDDILDGPDSLSNTILAGLIYSPQTPFGQTITDTQLDRIATLNPTLVLMMDVYGNDLLTAILHAPDRLALDDMTPIDALTDDIRRLLDRVADITDAPVFITDLPNARHLPLTSERKRRVLAAAAAAATEAGDDPDQAIQDADTLFAAQLIELDDIIDAANAALRAEADARPNVHLVPLAASVEAIANDGLVVEGQALSLGRFGGLAGLDLIHFSDTGYAVSANVFIDTINATLGTDVPPVDIAAVVASDPESPDNLRASGLDIDACAPLP